MENLSVSNFNFSSISYVSVCLKEVVADYLKLASYQQKLGLWNELLNTSEKIMQLSPGNVQTLWRLANIALDQGKFEQASEYLNQIFELDIENLNPSLKELIISCINEVNNFNNSVDLNTQDLSPSPKYSPIYQEIFSKLYKQDPYVGFKVEEDANYRIISTQEGPEVFDYLISNVRPKLILEVGSWQGSSAIYMAQLLEKYNVEDAVIICVDTWLGSPEHWLNTASHVNDTWSYDNLKITQGFPNIYKTFLSNVINTGNQHRIIPFPQTSENAFTILKHLGIKFDLIYLDAAHEYEIVKQELNLFSELISEQGILFGDDYGWWPGVTQAVDNFIDQYKLKGYVRTGKFIVVKPDQDLPGVEEATSTTLKVPALSAESLPHFSTDNFHNPEIQEIPYCLYYPNETPQQKDLDVLICSNTYLKNKALNIQNNPLNEEYYANFNKLATLSHFDGLFKIADVRFGGERFYLEKKLGLYLSDFYFAPCEDTESANLIINEAFVLYVPDPNNYFHYIIDGLLSLEYYKKLGLNCPIIFCNKSNLQDYELKYLDALEINLDQVLLMSAELRHTLVKTAYIPNIAGRTWKINSIQTKFLREIGDIIVEKHLPKDELNHHFSIDILQAKKIYISRKDSVRRPLVNETEVEAFLLEEGFTIIEMSKLSLVEQILIMQNASFIIAPHGAALVNLAFCSEGTKVIELANKENFVPIFQRIGVYQKLKMFHVLGQLQGNGYPVSAGGNHDLTWGKWGVDISLLSTVLQLALAS